MSEAPVDRIGDTADAERRALAGTVREFARREVVPRAPALDAGSDDAAQRCWSGVQRLGLDRALLAEGAGGAALRRGDFLVVLEELAVGDGGLALRVLLSNAALASLAPEAAAAVPDDERWALVPPMIAGAPGYELLRERGRGKRSTVEGRLPAVPGIFGTDGLVAFAANGAPPEAIALAPDAPGLSLRRDRSQMGLRAAAAADLVAEGAEAEPSDSGISSAAAQALVQAGVAAIARGISRRAYELAWEYAQSRYQGGVSIIEHGAVREMLAHMLVRLRAAGPASSETASPGGSAESAGLADALAAKVSATDAAVATTTDAVQVFGGIGYMLETGVEKLMRDAKYCQLYPEPNWLAREELVRLERGGPGSVQSA